MTKHYGYVTNNDILSYIYDGNVTIMTKNLNNYVNYDIHNYDKMSKLTYCNYEIVKIDKL